MYLYIIYIHAVYYICKRTFMAWLLVDVIWLQRIWLWIRLLSGKVFWVFWLGGKGSGVETSASWTGGGGKVNVKAIKVWMRMGTSGTSKLYFWILKLAKMSGPLDLNFKPYRQDCGEIVWMAPTPSSISQNLRVDPFNNSTMTQWHNDTEWYHCDKNRLTWYPEDRREETWDLAPLPHCLQQLCAVEAPRAAL